ncbi:MAG TPA: HK97 family phage prohead protease [Candidatus Limnocylindrales bacterium]
MDEERAAWDAAYINDLPDSAFLYIKPGGEKDDTGRTTPRDLRMFPVRDASGNIDMPHLRNAMSRIPQADLSQAIKDRLTAQCQRLMDQMSRSESYDEFEVRGTDLWPDADFELRAEGDGLSLTGYAALYGVPSLPIPGGPRGAFTETIRQGAFARTLSRKPDVTLRYQHNLTSLPLARTKAGTMSLAEDERGLRVAASLPDNEIGRPVRDAIRRGDISGMSFRFRVPSKAGEAWSADYTKRELLDIALGAEVSVVDFPAYPDTSVFVRHLAEAAEVPTDDLAAAFAVLRDADARLSPEQRDLLYAAVGAKTDAPYLPPKLVELQKRLASAYGT